MSQTPINTLQTLANSPQTTANIWPTTRRKQMIWLAGLTSLTLVGQYVLLGSIWLGRNAADLPNWFFTAEKVLWGFRAIVEAAVVVYVSTTRPNNEGEGKRLLNYEKILIVFIVLTVGPMGASLGLRVELVDILTWWGVVVWNFIMSGISAVMLMAASYAYKVQPVNDDCMIVSVDDYRQMLATVEAAQEARRQAANDVADMLARVGDAERQRDMALVELRGIRDGVNFLQYLPGTALVKIIALFGGEATPPVETLAEVFGLKPPTVRGALAEAKKEINLIEG